MNKIEIDLERMIRCGENPSRDDALYCRTNRGIYEAFICAEELEEVAGCKLPAFIKLVIQDAHPLDLQPIESTDDTPYVMVEDWSPTGQWRGHVRIAEMNGWDEHFPQHSGRRFLEPGLSRLIGVVFPSTRCLYAWIEYEESE